MLFVIFHRRFTTCCENCCDSMCRPIKKLTGESAADIRYKQRKEERAAERRREDEMAAEEKAAKHAIRIEKQRLQLARLKATSVTADDISTICEQPKRTKPRKKLGWTPFKLRSGSEQVLVLRPTLYLLLSQGLFRLRNSPGVSTQFYRRRRPNYRRYFATR